MAVLKDLNWAQLNAALGGTAKIFLGENPQGDIGVLISVNSVNEESTTTGLEAEGVVKFLVRLREAAHRAQELANQSQGNGEKLGAFPPSSSGGIVSDGAILQVGTIQAEIVVASASEIRGQLAGAD